MWKIRSLTERDNHGKPKYWSNDVGWTWENVADVFTAEQRETQALPSGGVWELVLYEAQ